MNSKIPSMYLRYFIYSSEEAARDIRIYGSSAAPGTVIVKGVAKPYTSIVADPYGMPTDAIVVTKGDIRKIKYTEPTK